MEGLAKTCLNWSSLTGVVSLRGTWRWAVGEPLPTDPFLVTFEGMVRWEGCWGPAPLQQSQFQPFG